MLVGEENRGAKYLLLPIVVLQFYWMHLIAKSSIKKAYKKDDGCSGGLEKDSTSHNVSIRQKDGKDGKMSDAGSVKAKEAKKNE